MSFTIDLCNFVVRRDNTSYKISGVELPSKLQSGDVMVFQRGDTQYKYTINDPLDVSDILDTDIFVCTDVDDTTYKVTGDVVKSLISVDPESALQKCRIESFLRFVDCMWGCDSQYCREQCARLFLERNEDCLALISDNSN